MKSCAKALAAQQKPIRVASRSDICWQVIEAYESNEQASSDKDTKCLQKAEKVAEQKADQDKAQNGTQVSQEPDSAWGQSVLLGGRPPSRS